jgi:hypothetical protein
MIVLYIVKYVNTEKLQFKSMRSQQRFEIHKYYVIERSL